MSKTLTRLAFALWILGAPLVLVGCSEGEKAAPPPATTSTEAAPATPAPAETTTPAPTTPAEPAPTAK
jgi:hypothetical protein